MQETGILNQNGKQGKWRYFNKNGSLIKEVDFRNDVEHGYSKSYYQNGKLAMVEHFVNGIRDGLGYEYYEDGRLMEEWVYQKGVYMPLNFWDENNNQTLIDGNGFKITKLGYDGFDVIKFHIENGKLIKEEKISSSKFLGFIPDNENDL